MGHIQVYTGSDFESIVKCTFHLKAGFLAFLEKWDDLATAGYNGL